MNQRLFSRYVACALALAGCHSVDSNDDAGPCSATCSIDGGPATCTDLASDTANCGACGHECGTPYCMFGSCAVQLTPDSVGATSIAVNDGVVYWSALSTIMAMPVDGGATTQLAANQTHPGNVVADGARVYWTTSTGDLMVAPLDGGAASTLATGATRRPVFDSTNVYWVQSTDAGTALMTAPKLGGASSVVTSASQPSAVAVDDANVYVGSTTNDSIIKVAKADGGTSTLSAQSGVVDFISLDADHVYWPFTRVPKTGGTADDFDWTASESATTRLTAFVTDGTTVFWIGAPPSSGLGGDVADIVTTTTSGSAERVLLHCGGFGQPCPSDLALDSQSLYWAESAIYRVTKP